VRIIVAGSREGVNPQVVRAIVDRIYAKYPDATIVTGGARGVDTIADFYAKHLGMSTEVYPANWDKYGKRAGYLRNCEMANSLTENSEDFIVCIYPGRRTTGTAMMADIGRRAGFKVVELGLPKEGE
jgi:hypothetical protein